MYTKIDIMNFYGDHQTFPKFPKQFIQTFWVCLAWHNTAKNSHFELWEIC